jgi:fructose-1,6-bisphosphatase/inositol monophosphatase family enzyme
MIAAMLRLALRNAGRYRRRTALTCLAIAGGLALTIVGAALFNGVEKASLEHMMRSETAHVMVYPRDGDGAAALDLCYVACGRVDGFWELGLSPWDMAAGSLIVTEAGGRLTDYAGRPLNLRGRHMVASNTLLHRQMLDAIQPHLPALRDSHYWSG